MLLYLSIALSIISIVTIVACFFLWRKVNKLENDYLKFVRDTRAVVQSNQHNIDRLFRKTDPNTESIEMLEGQMAKVNELLGGVMGASDFLADTGFGSPADRVEEIKERLKWDKERRKLNQVNPSDYYQG